MLLQARVAALATQELSTVRWDFVLIVLYSEHLHSLTCTLVHIRPGAAMVIMFYFQPVHATCLLCTPFFTDKTDNAQHLCNCRGQVFIYPSISACLSSFLLEIGV